MNQWIRIDVRPGATDRLLIACSCSAWFLPPYSLDLNPIELARSKLKTLLREFGDALDDGIRRAMDLIDGADAAAWFARCGYSGQLKWSAL